MTQVSTVSSLSLIPPVVDTDNEVIERGRVKDPKSLVETDQVLWNADWEASRNRALVQAMVDEMPPFAEGRERLRGTNGRSNVNWGLAAQSLSEAVMPYNDILEALDVFGTVPTAYGDETEQARYSAIISEEITRMILNWRDFHSRWQQNAHLFVLEGLSFAFFDDDIDWRWKVVGQQQLKFPRRVQANVNAVDIFTCRVSMLPHELNCKIKDEDAAKDIGWNPSAVRAALKTAAPKGLSTDDPQEWERAWKDNDITLGTTCSTVETVHGWIREVDGTVSHYIARADGQGEWLYKCEGKYNSVDEMVIAYMYGVGANGDFQSIRGLGQKLFASCGGINRLLNKYLDMAIHLATPHLVCENEDVIQENAIRPFGPYAVITNGMQFAEQKVPNFDQTLQPAIQQLRDIFAVRSQPYATAPAAQLDKTQRTKYEMQLRSEQSGKLTTGGMNLFFLSWGTQFKEIVRRIKREDYSQSDPGGHEVWKFRMRCLKRGVPLAAIYQIDIDGIEINMGFGKGSATERRAVVGFLNESVFYRADQFAQNKLNNMMVAAYAGPRLANELFPPDQGLRPPMDLQIALLENNQMALGMPPAFAPNQDHIVHIATHLQRVFELNDALTNMETTLEEAIPQMFPIWQHAAEQHLPLVDPMNPAAKDFKEAIQQLGEVITNGQKHLDAEAKKAEKEGMVEGGENYGGTPASIYKQAVQAQTEAAKLNLDVEKQAINLEYDKAKRTQELIARDARFAQDIRHKSAMMRLKEQEAAAKAKAVKAPPKKPKAKAVA